jgi:hypothetical protein
MAIVSQNITNPAVLGMKFGDGSAAGTDGKDYPKQNSIFCLPSGLTGEHMVRTFMITAERCNIRRSQIFGHLDCGNGNGGCIPLREWCALRYAPLVDSILQSMVDIIFFELREGVLQQLPVALPFRHKRLPQ